MSFDICKIFLARMCTKAPIKSKSCFDDGLMYRDEWNKPQVFHEQEQIWVLIFSNIEKKRTPTLGRG